MTQELDSIAQALIERLKDAREYVSSESCLQRIDETIAAFEPAPEMEYVLPGWNAITFGQANWCAQERVGMGAWENLRECTKRPVPPKGRLASQKEKYQATQKKCLG